MMLEEVFSQTMVALFSWRNQARILNGHMRRIRDKNTSDILNQTRRLERDFLLCNIFISLLCIGLPAQKISNCIIHDQRIFSNSK